MHTTYWPAAAQANSSLQSFSTSLLGLTKDGTRRHGIANLIGTEITQVNSFLQAIAGTSLEESKAEASNEAIRKAETSIRILLALDSTPCNLLTGLRLAIVRLSFIQ